ncbi:MAG: hypothetical protein JNK33_05350 [Candidatus Doudnabacteria bacterium]|nr:hypothetical protein [Candidatus Doudnabacteria bacterium]
MDTYSTQIERLKRHYTASLRHYDLISFWDLSNALRIWTEYKNRNEEMFLKPLFIRWVFTKELRDTLKGANFIYSYLPDGITTYAQDIPKDTSRNIIYGPKISGDFSAATMVKLGDDGGMTVAEYLLSYKSFNETQVKILSDLAKTVPFTRVNYAEYMNSSAVHYRFSDVDTFAISNDVLIKRIANEYNASHAGDGQAVRSNNMYSKPVGMLMEYGCASLPLPYFLLLHIARSIIIAFDSPAQSGDCF